MAVPLRGHPWQCSGCGQYQLPQALRFYVLGRVRMPHEAQGAAALCAHCAERYPLVVDEQGNVR